MSLRSLPSEVLALILDGENSFLTLELWKTGDSLLMAKLRNRGIEHMDLHSSETRGAPLWPRCLKEFKLRSLRFTASKTAAPLRLVAAELMRLHVGLETISFDFYEALNWFIEPPADECKIVGFGDFNPSFTLKTNDSTNDPSSIFNAKSWLDFYRSEEGDATPSKRRKIASVESQETLSDRWSPLKAFPNLRSLTLVCHGRFARSRLCAFPSLTSLALTPTAAVNCSSLTSLKTLSLCDTLAKDRLELTLKLCPTSLTTLNCGSSTVKDFLSNQVWTLYPNLRTIGDFTFIVDPYKTTPLVPGQTPSAPHQALVARYDNVASAPLMPPLLESPPHFHLASRLITLDLNWLGFDEQHFCLLPRTLRTLNLVSFMCEGLEPDRLFDLGAAVIQGADAPLWHQCKQELLSYGLTRKGVDMDWIETYIGRVERGMLFGLPVGLTRLRSDHHIYRLDETLLLPPKLTELDTRLKSTHNTFFNSLPPFIADLSIYFQGDPMGANCPRFKRMAYLRSIRIECNTSIIPLLAWLPTGLSSLELHGTSALMTSTVISALPARLESLRIGNLIIDFSALPRSLRDLRYHGSPIAAAQIKDLPPRLERLTCNTNLTTDSLFDLPRTLRVLDASKSYKGLTLPVQPLQSMPGWRNLLDTMRPFYRVFELSETELGNMLVLGHDDASNGTRPHTVSEIKHTHPFPN